MPTTSLSKPLPRQTLFAEVPDVEAVAEETSASGTNRMLRAGWRLLLSFTYQNQRTIPTAGTPENPMFVARDVCDVLGIF